MLLADADTFGKRVKYYRLCLGISAATLARHLGLAPNTVTQIESDHHYPSVARAQQIAEALRVHTGNLFPRGWTPRQRQSPRRFWVRRSTIT